MFRRSLKEKLSTVFGIAKVTYDSPSEAQEQDCIFIHVDSTIARTSRGQAKIRVMGRFSIFTNSEKLPFGFFNKRIEQADFSDTQNLFFYDIDKNRKYFGNLVERSCNFVYFFKEQYDPATGEITSVNFIEGDEE